jgi:protein-S-isoprenylcysteine O-methyltransferase Ste14
LAIVQRLLCLYRCLIYGDVGFPLTIYLLSGWLQRRFPQLDLMSHDAGHLWWTLLGIKGNPHFNVLHIFSNILIFGGFIYLSSAWEILYRAQRGHILAKSGPYATIRHPQYVAFIIIMFGFLIQWPTLLTLIMFPILMFMYIRLARQEEREALAEFGDEYAYYAATTPAFIPKWGTGASKKHSLH